MLVHKLNSNDFESNYVLIAIHCNNELFKLAFELNRKLKIQLKKLNSDLAFEDKGPVFEAFKHESELYNTKIYLLSNVSTGKSLNEKNLLFNNYSVSRFLIPELKKAECLLKIEGGGFNISNLIEKVNQIPVVVSAYMTEANKLKSKYNLIFE